MIENLLTNSSSAMFQMLSLYLVRIVTREFDDLKIEFFVDLFDFKFFGFFLYFDRLFNDLCSVLNFETLKNLFFALVHILFDVPLIQLISVLDEGHFIIGRSSLLNGILFVSEKKEMKQFETQEKNN